MLRPTTSRRWWQRLFRWPTFLALATLHLLVLPLVLGEPGDRVLSVVAGLAYLMLAAADLRWSSAGDPTEADRHSARCGRRCAAYRSSSPV
ncbi:MAG TPA: hypothetical protein VIL36_04900 [Acidimicrobiales bacterium]